MFVGPMYVCKDIALHRFLHIEAIWRQKEARSRDYALPLFRMTSMVLLVRSTMDSTVGPTLHGFEQFGAMYMNNHNDTFPVRPGFKPGTSRLVDKNESFYLKLRYFKSRELGSLKFRELRNSLSGVQNTCKDRLQNFMDIDQELTEKSVKNTQCWWKLTTTSGTSQKIILMVFPCFFLGFMRICETVK